MSNLSLSKAVRSNLLSLQSTASMMAKTQTRLATGLKVNTALDNPTNFFTAASLNGRAGDLSNLLDGLSNGIKTIEAADNGLKSITKTVESMQSTLRQARQDKSFKSQSFSIDSAAAGNLTLGGGAVGSTPVDVALGYLSGSPTQSSVSAIGDYYSPMAFSAEVQMDFIASMQSVDAAGGFAFDMKVNGSDFSLVVDGTMMAGIGDNDAIVDDELELLFAVAQAAVNSGASAAGLQVALIGDKLSLSTTNTGSTQSLSVEAASSVAAGYGITAGASDTGVDAGWNFTISNGSQTANIALTTGNANDAATARATIASQLSAQGVGGITVGGAGDQIDLLGEPDGSNSVSVGGDTRSVQFVFGGGTNDPATVPGSLGNATGTSVDEMVQLINSVTPLQGKVRASSDNGKLRI